MSTVSESVIPAPDRVAPSETELPAGAHRRRAWVRPAQVSAVFMGWLSAIVAASMLHPVAELRPYALFGHLVFLAISFGAVLAVELHGLALLCRFTSVGRVFGVAAGLDPLIWGGLVGLAVSGVLLAPNLDRPLTIVKLLAVLAVAMNGLWVRDLAHRMRRLPPETRGVPRSLLGRGARLSAVSQLGWWTAVIIGFLTTNG